jgi:hypothetical protein
MASVDEMMNRCKKIEGFRDSGEYLQGIVDWREAWRPAKIRVVLVAESHVGQKTGDLKARVKKPVEISRSLPEGYVRLVYCLGYGEDSLCSPIPKENSGTKQFWDLFGAVANCDTNAKQPRRSQGASDEERLAWNLDVLNTLERKGVWLVDASIAPL